MRRLRRFLPSEIYFVTIRTVEVRFALDAYACPGAWQEPDGKQLDFAAKQEMRERGRACIDATAALTKTIFISENAPKVPRPNVPYTTFTDSIRNIIGQLRRKMLQWRDSSTRAKYVRHAYKFLVNGNVETCMHHCFSGSVVALRHGFGLVRVDGVDEILQFRNEVLGRFLGHSSGRSHGHDVSREVLQFPRIERRIFDFMDQLDEQSHQASA